MITVFSKQGQGKNKQMFIVNKFRVVNTFISLRNITKVIDIKVVHMWIVFILKHYFKEI